MMVYRKLLLGLKAWGARDELSALADIMGQEQFLDHMWRERYPATAPKASSGWPFKRGLPDNVRPLKHRQRPF
jgi:hypothetical protein